MTQGRLGNMNQLQALQISSKAKSYLFIYLMGPHAFYEVDDDEGKVEKDKF